MQDNDTIIEVIARNIDVFNDQIILAISIVLGLNHSTTIANDVHYLRTIMLLVFLSIAAFVAKVRLDIYQRHKQSPWHLVARAGSQMIKGVQQFATILAIQIITQRVRILNSEAENIDFWSRLLLYGIFLILIITLPIIVKWYLFEQYFAATKSNVNKDV